MTKFKKGLYKITTDIVEYSEMTSEEAQEEYDRLSALGDVTFQWLNTSTKAEIIKKLMENQQ